MVGCVLAGLLTLGLSQGPPVLQIGSPTLAYSIRGGGMGGGVLENLISRAVIDLGSGPEVELETGDTPDRAHGAALRPLHQTRTADRASLQLRSTDQTLDVEVALEADQKWPVLHKVVTVTNAGSKPVRLLNVVLARFPVRGARIEGGERGFPLYVDGQFFFSLAHPAGFAHVEGREVVLRQYPGVWLAPGQKFQSTEAVYGVAPKGGARKLFVDYVRSRMARVKYGHDKPYAILEAFGGQPDGDFKENYSIGVSESFLVKHLDEVDESELQNRVQFDYYSIEFWHDRAGDLTGFKKENFPNGFDRVRDRILGLGMKPGLWIASSGTPDWTIDLNPAVRDCFNVRPGVGAFCRASEPINQIYKDGFRYQMRENHVGLLKFDNLEQECVNPAHSHLPGPLYSTEAIYNGVIDFFQTLRKANPDVFLMLYWGYRSPWWLEYGDTYFECGDHIEAASPAQYPTPYARDSVTQRLDQAQLKITDTPWLGKDSLGVWLSDWTWNSGIGKDRWQEGLIMDLARGGLLMQIWTDANWLTPPERSQVATFIDLFKANAACFDNSRPILGTPEKAEPYGYSCSDGRRAFLAIDNACLADRVVPLELGQACGLPAGHQWDVYRWYPDPARLHFSGEAAIAMRPYEVVLLEVVRAGDKPSLGRSFAGEAALTGFAEKTRSLPVNAAFKPSTESASKWAVLRPSKAASAKGARLTVLKDASVLASGSNDSEDTYTIDAPVSGQVSGVLIEMLTDDSLPSRGPGRAVNGNFALRDVRLRIGSREVALKSARADYSQTSFGGWPVSATIDADTKTGWSIHPKVGQSHALVLELAEPTSAPKGSELSLTLAQGENHHNLGRFRISVTGERSPDLPLGYRAGTLVLSCDLPATKTGGLFLLVGGSGEDQPVIALNGSPLGIKSVWAQRSNWDCPWSAWRAEVPPSKLNRHVDVRIDRLRDQARAEFKAYFLPK